MQNRYNYRGEQAVYIDEAVDEKLRAHMLGIYKYMAAATFTTGFVSFYLISNSALFKLIFGSNLGNIFMFIPLLLVLIMSFLQNKMSVNTLKIVFFAYAASLGVAISPIFLIYTTSSVASTFFLAFSLFASMSIYGYSTHKSLSNWGSVLYMAVLGIFLAIIINMFVASSNFDYLISIGVVGVFTALTAYETQQLKNFYFEYGVSDTEDYKKITIMSALSLYMNLVNIFLHLLRLIGRLRD